MEIRRILSKAEYKLISPTLETMERLGIKSLSIKSTTHGSLILTREGDNIVEITIKKRDK